MLTTELPRFSNSPVLSHHMRLASRISRSLNSKINIVNIYPTHLVSTVKPVFNEMNKDSALSKIYKQDTVS